MSISITPKSIGHFNTVKELQAYKRIQRIEKDVEHVKDVFTRLDNTNEDGNISKDIVVLDSASLSIDSGLGYSDQYSGITGVLRQSSEGARLEGELEHSVSEYSITPIAPKRHGYLNVTFTDSPETAIYESPAGQFTLDKASGTKTLRTS